MRRDLFEPSIEGEARLLLLISGFTTPRKSLEGRTKLAKLDFFLRYPAFLHRAMKIAGRPEEIEGQADMDIETRMVRYRYGPWDPAYFALLGRLIGKGLVAPVPVKRGIGYRATDKGKSVARRLAETDEWREVAETVKVLRSNFDYTGSHLKNFIYSHFPEVTDAEWGDVL